MYSYFDRVSYSEVDNEQNLNYYALVNYMQDCGCFHSDDIGYGLEYLAPRKLGWFVTNYEIHIIRMPRYSEKIKISTYPYNFKGMLGSRVYTIESETGELLMYADSLWVLMDLDKLRPARLPDEIREAYGTEPPEREFQFEGSKLKYQGNGIKVGNFVVSEMYIDTNGHMNNSFYIDVTRRFLPTQEFDTIKINYKKAAQLQDNLEVLLVEVDNGYQVILEKDGDVYTIVEYK